MKIFRKIISYLVIFSLSQASFAQSSFSLNDLALPSEVKDLKKTAGSIYYSPTSKGKPLVPVHFWGEVKKSGLHYIPVDTTLVSGISLAGGLTSSADLESVKVTQRNKKQVEHIRYNLTDGGSEAAYTHVLRPGDTVFVKKSRFYENRSYYTSLIGVLATIVSSWVLLDQIKK